MTATTASRIDRVQVGVYTVPTDAPESDGTLAWESTTLVTVELSAGGKTGLGYTYADAGTARLIADKLADLVEGTDPMSVPRTTDSLIHAIRNLGRPGIASMAIAAVDIALWDLKARLLDVPLVTLLGPVRDSVPLYGSGGFTAYPVDRLQRQLESWAEEGMAWVKMKVGRQPEADLERVQQARAAVGDRCGLMVDANGAYSRKQGLAEAEKFALEGVVWLEEPVSSDDPEGLRLLRDRAPGGLEISTGEYGYHLPYFRHMLQEGAVDVLQADVTRATGISGLLDIGALCSAHQIPLSTHTAPAASLHVACALPQIRHVEWFHDHVRIERRFFDGWVGPEGGRLAPDLSRAGHGLDLKHEMAQLYAV